MIIAIVFISIFTISDALSDAFMFRDFRNRTTSANKVWHMAQAVRQGAAIIFAAWAANYWVLGVIAAAGFWIVHDVLVNIIGLNRSPFYVGNTAMIDRFFQRFKNPERAMGMAKFALLTAAVGLTMIFKP